MQRRSRSLLCLLALLLLAPPTGAPLAASTTSTGSEVELDRLKSAVNQQVRDALQVSRELGVHIVEVHSGREVYSYRGETPRIAASNTKLATSAAALNRLGPGFFFETPVKLRGETRDGVLFGDLGVVGGGDPNISGRHYLGDPFGAFREWAAALRARGVRQIAGEIVLASGFFDKQYVHPDWPENQLDRWYEAPVAALSFNDNCVLVEVRPTGGEQAEVVLTPQLPLFRVGGQVDITGRSREQSVRIGRRTDVRDLRMLRTYNVYGRIYQRSAPVDKWVTVHDPIAYFGAALVRGLQEEGIVVHGKVVEANRLEGADWRPLLVHRSDLLTTLDVVNKRSQNFYSESVIKLLGARHCGEGSWPAGTRAVGEFLDAAGVDRGWSLADGSGMSRGNRFAPRQLTQVLRYMFRHRWGAEFVRTLPYSGEAGLSWHDRLDEAPYGGNVLAKTGTLNGVSTLSGFAKGRSGTLYAFSILCNRTTANWRAKRAQDSILRALIDHG
ncbi:MAG: D-alanyl-D-alanine carboxypeptidase/D-alanyl-D-alanine-endopeptidase [Acidobacteriota bacterium]